MSAAPPNPQPSKPQPCDTQPPDTQPSTPTPPDQRRRRRVVIVLLVVLALLVGLGVWLGTRRGDSPRPAPTATGPSAGACAKGERPYAADSPWNTPIPSDAATDPLNATYVAQLTATGKTLTADPDQYTIPVYCIDATTPRTPIALTGYFSSYTETGNRKGHGYAPTIDEVPMPAAAASSDGSDGQIVLWDSAAGVEYAFWQYATRDGTATATNGYRAGAGPDDQGRFADGKAGRGAGLPYLAGLVRRQEVERGAIEHALAFGYKYPSKQIVYPASKSDGLGQPGRDLPEGARLQLDPDLTDEQLRAMGVSDTGLVVAKALQRYGMYVVDNSGSSKIYLEDRRTAKWPADVKRDLMGTIGWDNFRVVEPPRPPTGEPRASEPRTSEPSTSESSAAQAKESTP